MYKLIFFVSILFFPVHIIAQETPEYKEPDSLCTMINGIIRQTNNKLLLIDTFSTTVRYPLHCFGFNFENYTIDYAVFLEYNATDKGTLVYENIDLSKVNHVIAKDLPGEVGVVNLAFEAPIPITIIRDGQPENSTIEVMTLNARNTDCSKLYEVVTRLINLTRIKKGILNASSKIEQDLAWEEAKGENSFKSYDDFYKKYPTSVYAGQAQSYAIELDKTNYIERLAMNEIRLGMTKQAFENYIMGRVRGYEIDDKYIQDLQRNFKLEFNAANEYNFEYRVHRRVRGEKFWLLNGQGMISAFAEKEIKRKNKSKNEWNVYNFEDHIIWPDKTSTFQTLLKSVEGVSDYKLVSVHFNNKNTLDKIAFAIEFKGYNDPRSLMNSLKAHYGQPKTWAAPELLFALGNFECSFCNYGKACLDMKTWISDQHDPPGELRTIVALVTIAYK